MSGQPRIFVMGPAGPVPTSSSEPWRQPPIAFKCYPPPSANFAAVRVREVGGLLNAAGQPTTLSGDEGWRDSAVAGFGCGRRPLQVISVREVAILLSRLVYCRSYTTRPPTTVIVTRASRIDSGGIVVRSRSIRTRSASFPRVSDPFRASSKEAVADPMV